MAQVWGIIAAGSIKQKNYVSLPGSHIKHFCLLYGFAFALWCTSAFDLIYLFHAPRSLFDLPARQHFGHSRYLDNFCLQAQWYHASYKIRQAYRLQIYFHIRQRFSRQMLLKHQTAP